MPKKNDVPKKREDVPEEREDVREETDDVKIPLEAKERFDYSTATVGDRFFNQVKKDQADNHKKPQHRV